MESLDVARLSAPSQPIDSLEPGPRASTDGLVCEPLDTPGFEQAAEQVEKPAAEAQAQAGASADAPQDALEAPSSADPATDDVVSPQAADHGEEAILARELEPLSGADSPASAATDVTPGPGDEEPPGETERTPWLTPPMFTLFGEQMTDELEEGIALLDVEAEHALVYCNRAFEQLTGYDAGELLGQPCPLFEGPEDRPSVRALTLAMEEGRAHTALSVQDDLDGAPVVHEVSVAPLYEQTNERSYVLVTLRDRSELSRLLHRVERGKITDELTGLLNLRGLSLLGEQQLRSAARYGRPLFVLLVDIDELDAINAQEGSAAGDRALCRLARVLAGTFRDADLIARLDADEFVILAEGDLVAAEAARHRFEDSLREHNASVPEDADPLVASTGLMLHDPRGRAGLDELLAGAEAHMERTKQNRKAARLSSAIEPLP